MVCKTREVLVPIIIRELVSKLDTTKSSEEQSIWEQLKPLGKDIVPYFLEFYPKFKKSQGRTSLVFHSIKYAKSSEEAFALGLAALTDSATLVRYRACGLLAYSQRRDAVPHLKHLLTHKDSKTVEDAKAAIDAISSGNHHYFIDRNHTGKVFWEVTDIR